MGARLSATGPAGLTDAACSSTRSHRRDVYLPREGKALAKPNARSCVLRVTAAGHAMLLTADIEMPQEGALIERQKDAIAADVMLVPHHGSRTSSTAAFLDAVHPQLAIVQAGYLNRFGHPRPDVLARYAARGIPVLRNDRDEFERDRRRSLSRQSPAPPVRPLIGIRRVGKFTCRRATLLR
jgi:hypothetical protein